MRYHDLIAESTTNNVAVFYGGRFQPMHQGHYALYKKLVSRFGAANVFIATTFSKDAQKQQMAGDYSKNPFNFDEKAAIISKMFNIPANHILNTSPYRPNIELIGRKPNETAVVLAFSEKDDDRLMSGGALAPLPDAHGELQAADENRVYFVKMPVEAGGMSATDFRDTMASDADPKQKAQVFQQFFGKFDQEIFNFIEERLT
jgi:hypothetical protein